MKIENAVVLVTGANRGIGLAFTRELLARGARKVYAGARDPASITLSGVAPIRLDVTKPAEIAAAAPHAPDVRLLINTAGIAHMGGFLAANSEEDIQGQQRLVEDVLNKNYKAIGVAPISPVSLIQAVSAATKKGIYVVNIDEKIDQGQLKAAGGAVIAFISSDNVALGNKAGDFIAQNLGSSGGKVAIIEGKAGNVSGDARRDGAKQAFAKVPSIKLVASQPGDWDRSKALDVTTNILQRNPDLKAIYAANDTMALGAAQAVKNADKLGKVVVVGTDGVPEALDSVKRGELTATVAQDSAAMGAKAVDLLLDALKNKPAIDPNKTPEFLPIESHRITK